MARLELAFAAEARRKAKPLKRGGSGGAEKIGWSTRNRPRKGPLTSMFVRVIKRIPQHCNSVSRERRRRVKLSSSTRFHEARQE